MSACFAPCFLGLRRHRRRDQAPAEPPIDRSTYEHSVDIKFFNALTGDRLDVAELQLDLTMPVAMTRGCMASFLQVNQVLLMDEGGNVLNDDDVLFELRVSHVQVEIRNERMSVQAPAASPDRSTHEHPVDIKFSNALTGDRLDVAELQLDLALPVAITRDCLANFLQVNQVLLIDEGGNVLNDDDVLFELCVSHVQVVVIKNERMSIDQLLGLESRDPDSSRDRRHRLRSELPRVSPEFRVEMNEAHLDDGVVHVFLAGPEGTLYEDVDCELLMKFPVKYPFSPPQAWFVNEIEHWSVTPAGKVLLDVLSDQWTPALTTDKILWSITALLAEPAP